jgi:hypothetical protein
MRNANLQQTLQARDGIAILSVMLIIVILSSRHGADDGSGAPDQRPRLESSR